MNNATRTIIAILAFFSLHNPVAAQAPVVASTVESVDTAVIAVTAATAADPVAPVDSPIASYPSLLTNDEITAAAQLNETTDGRTGITVFGATPETQDRLDWAMSRFAAADLELPYLEIHFFDSREPCDGYAGAFRQSQTPLRIDVCNTNKLVILHELAHAWDKHNLDSDVRDTFMELRGLDSWNAQTDGWKDRGVEDLADVVVWGLMEYTGGFGAEAASKLEAFVVTTGVNPPRNDTSTGAASTGTEPSADDYS